MDARPEQPPEGRLIAEALERTGMSIRKASKRAGISYGRWRQIASGVQNVSPGSFASVRAPARTLARMAAVVSVTPAGLEQAGRADAAEILRELQHETASADSSPEPSGFTPEEEEQIVVAAAEILRRRAAGRDTGETPGVDLFRRGIRAQAEKQGRTRSDGSRSA